MLGFSHSGFQASYPAFHISCLLDFLVCILSIFSRSNFSFLTLSWTSPKLLFNLLSLLWKLLQFYFLKFYLMFTNLLDCFIVSNFHTMLSISPFVF